MTIARAVSGWCAGQLVFLLMFATGLVLDWKQLRQRVHRGPFWGGCAVALFAVPLLAFVVATLVPIGPRARGLLLIMAASPGLPMAVRTARRQQSDVPLALALAVTLSLAAIVMLPLWLVAVGAAFDFDLYARPRSLLLAVATAVIVPLGLGVAVRRMLPNLAPRLYRLVDIVFKVAFAIVGVAVLVTYAPVLGLINVWVVLAMLLVIGGSALLGHLAGGPQPEDRVIVAIAASFGNPMLALHVVQVSYPELQLAPLIFAYLVLRALALAPYFRWRRTRGRV